MIVIIETTMPKYTNILYQFATFLTLSSLRFIIKVRKVPNPKNINIMEYIKYGIVYL